MKRPHFHHPDFCPTVLRRRIGLELLMLADIAVRTLTTRGYGLYWGEDDLEKAAYRSAKYRLARAGLVAYRRTGGKTAVLQMTDAGRERLPEVCRPERRWRRKWNGTWYVLLYDVPESERRYRNTLRHFLRRKRVGRLQQSVWVTPEDIRPEFSDLVDAAGIDEYAYLFESRSVLGRPDRDIVREAWDLDRLRQVQAWYCEQCENNLRIVKEGNLHGSALTSLAREELNAYLAAMETDPLLPRKLWPAGYIGQDVLALHRSFHRAVLAEL